jgi:benzoate-CoA ligase family protein
VGDYNASSWLVDRHVSEGRGDRVAIRSSGESLTYAQLQAEVFRAQHALADRGVGRGDRVALVVNDEPAFVAWFLGAMRSGAVPVPLSTMLTADDIAAIVADARASLVVASAEHAARTDRLDAPAGRVVIGESSWDDYDDRSEAELADTDETSTAFWLYSSGTTGTPKGVMHRHASLQATADTFARTILGATEDDRFLSVAKLFFAYGLGNSLTFPLAVGGTAILDPERPTPPGMVQLIADERPTLFFASPGFVAALLDAAPDPSVFATVRATITAGESLPGDLQRRFSATFGMPVLDGIGTTEALHIFISNTPDEQIAGTSGRPVPGYEAKLLDEHGTEVSEPDTPGFLHVRGPSIADGYWERPDATAAAFLADGWLRTGDVYMRSVDGHWTFLGRNNDMIKAGGIWVSPAEVESVLIEHPSVLEAAVVGARNVAGLEEVVAFVVPASGHAVAAAELEQHCRSRMAAFKRPRRIVVVDDLPKTATGKIRRFELRESLSSS